MASFTFGACAIPDVLLIEAPKYRDHRGHFMETFNCRDFDLAGIGCDFVQDNQSLSLQRGTIRGLHFQVPPRAQAKLIRVLAGSVYDVAVDLRHGSPSFGKWCAAELSAENCRQLFIPTGFAHGFCTLEPNTQVAYKVSDYYAPELETGLIWNDPDLAISWPIEAADIVISEKDATLARWRQFESPFVHASGLR
jgi:dTDP-4-dehydrorhamnose 3,5-epimerase